MPLAAGRLQLKSLHIRVCLLSPPKATKQGAKMDAAPQTCLWLQGLSSRTRVAESSCAGSMDLIKTRSADHLFARDDASSHVSPLAPGRAAGAWGATWKQALPDCSSTADFPSLFSLLLEAERTTCFPLTCAPSLSNTKINAPVRMGLRLAGTC